MRIQHNIAAMNSYRNYNINAGSLNKNLEKLSSGYKINRAGDDAAGLAISEKMRAQITGLETASKNVKDGISLVKTAEGAMQEIHDMLNRMEELATQSANGTYDDKVDRSNLQKEVEALKSEINRIADSSNFNGINLLDGKMAAGSAAESAVTTGKLAASVDGALPSAATKAEYTIKLGEFADFENVTVNTTDSKDGTTPSPATHESIFFKAGTNAKALTIGANGATTEITIGTSTLKSLGDIAVDAAGTPTKISDLFDLKIDGEIQDDSWATDNTTTLISGKTYELVAKTPGALNLTNAITVTDSATTAGGLSGSAVITKGQDAGSAPSGTTSSATFDVSYADLGGGESFTIDGTTFQFVSSDAAITGDATAKVKNGATLINIYNKSGADIAAEINKALADTTNGLGTTNYATKVEDLGTSCKVTIETKATGPETNINITTRDDDSSADAFGAVTRTPGTGAGGTSGVNGTLVYTLDEATLTTGSRLSFDVDGVTKTITVVDDGTAADQLGLKGDNYFITKTDAANGTKIEGAFKALGIKDQIEFDTGNDKLTITSDADDAKTVNALKNQYNLQFSKATGTTADNTLNALDLNYSNMDGYAKLLDATVNGHKIRDLFDVTVNGNEITNEATKFGIADEIKLVAKNAGALDKEIVDALTSWKSGASGDGVNGLDEGVAADNYASYTMEFDFNKTAAGGQSFTIGNKTFELSADGTQVNKDASLINLSKYDLTKASGKNAAMEAIGKAVAKQISSLDAKVKDGKLVLTSKTEGTAGNLGDVKISQNNGGIKATYNAVSDAKDMAGDYASVSYELDMSQLRAGDSLTLGGTTIEIDDSMKTGEDVAAALTAAGFKGATVSFADGKLTVTDINKGTKAADLQAGAGKLTTSAQRDTEVKGGIVLQIGDTAEDFNKLTLQIGDMHTEAMGTEDGKSIADINISNIDDASAAIDVIKDAINYVSSVRGDLGAAQNRLEHTSNNLSVMTENIQDAESTIRDTDVASEMMQYTKNNILLQSAQAMLAQANQLPQGVLQLLG